VASVFLEPVEQPVETLLRRWSRTHGPFETQDVAARYGIVPAQATLFLQRLAAEDRLLHGAFRPGGADDEWCDPDVLRQIKRRTIAHLRGQVAPVPRQVLGRFLPAWHRVSADDPHERLEDAIVQLEGVPLSYRELVRMILPARVRGFRQEHLDELGALGWLVWVGHSPLRHDDGRVMLFRRDRVPRLLLPVEMTAAVQLIDGFDHRHRRLLEHLDTRGASFHGELVAVLGDDVAAADALDAVWDLVWAGLVTNDTFAALRHRGGRGRGGGRGRRGGWPAGTAGRGDAEAGSASLRGWRRGRRRGAGGAPVPGVPVVPVAPEVPGAMPGQGTLATRRGQSVDRPSPRRRMRTGWWRGDPAGQAGAGAGIAGGIRSGGAGHGSGAGAGPGGRWSLVRDLVRGQVTSTERAHAWAATLLERHGLVARETAGVESLGGGFAGVYQVLRSMEEAGRVRRGYFVEGLGGAQFTYPGVVDRLRRERDTEPDGVVVAMAAMDPANPYGWLLPWPPLQDSQARAPTRAAGAAVVLVDGEPVLYVDRNGRRLRTFCAASPELVALALPGLRDVARGRPGRVLSLERVGDEPAIRSPLTAQLRQAGFTQDYRAMRLRA
jgi:ATP-dependent helicase Lhr and Lhr-like helicase